MWLWEVGGLQTWAGPQAGMAGAQACWAPRTGPPPSCHKLDMARARTVREADVSKPERGRGAVVREAGWISGRINGSTASWATEELFPPSVTRNLYSTSLRRRWPWEWWGGRLTASLGLQCFGT